MMDRLRLKAGIGGSEWSQLSGCLHPLALGPAFSCLFCLSNAPSVLVGESLGSGVQSRVQLAEFLEQGVKTMG